MGQIKRWSIIAMIAFAMAFACPAAAYAGTPDAQGDAGNQDLVQGYEENLVNNENVVDKNDDSNSNSNSNNSGYVEIPENSKDVDTNLNVPAGEGNDEKQNLVEDDPKDPNAVPVSNENAPKAGGDAPKSPVVGESDDKLVQKEETSVTDDANGELTANLQESSTDSSKEKVKDKEATDTNQISMVVTHQPNDAQVSVTGGSTSKDATDTKGTDKAKPEVQKEPQSGAQGQTTTKTDAAKTANTPAKTQAAKVNTGKGDLAAGTYYIMSAMLACQVLDVAGVSKADGANVLLWHVNGQKNEQWKVEIGKDGYAVLRSVNSGKVLDVSGAKAKNGANVIQWRYNGGKNQKWIVKKQGSYYALQSAMNPNLVIDLTGNSRADGTNVEIWKYNGGKNQLFSFISATPKGTSAGTRTVTDGMYQLRPSVAGGRPVDIEGASTANGANALIWQANGGANQAFYFAYDGKGFYTVTSVKSGKQLAPAAACSVPGINVGQYNLGNADLAKWKVEKSGSSYRLVNKVTGQALDISGGRNANGANVQTWNNNSGANQKYTLKSQPLMPTGPAVIQLVAGNMVLDVYNNSMANGAKLGTWQASGALNQKFLITKYGSGYTIRPFNSRLYLTASSNNVLVQDKAHAGMKNQVWNAVASNGAVVFVNATTGKAINVNGNATKASGNVTTTKKTGSATQRFYIQSVPVVSEGVYYIAASSNMSKVLDVQGAKRTNNVNVDLWAKNNGNNQKWLITSAGNGAYRITSVASGRALDVAGASKANGANVALYTYKGSDNQKWKIEFNDDFTLRFTAVHSGKRLDVSGAKIANGSNIQTWSANNSAAQKFWLQEAQKSSEVVRIGVPCYMQNPELPTGCESVALTNALRYWGYSLGKTTIANNWMPYGDDGVYDFIGNPYDSSGWIICAPGIKNTANDYLSSKGSSIRARNVTGTSLNDLRTYLDKGCPVVVWTTIDMGSPGAVSTYRHGYPLRSNNHAVVLTGYNPNNGMYQVADSLAGTVWRNGSSFSSLYNAMGQQAVVLED